MKFLILLPLLMISADALARGLCWRFDVNDPHASIKKLSVRSGENPNNPIWTVKATGSDGQVLRGSVICKSGPENEWTCRRDDDGGEFTLLKTGEAARFQTMHFDFGNEGSSADSPVLESTDIWPWTMNGEIKPCALPKARPRFR